MKRLGPVGYLLLVGALFLAGDRSLSYALDQVVTHSQFRFSRVYHGGLDADVLVVGDSRAVHSIFAPELGKRLCRPVFNMGFNGMSTEIAEALVRDYLDRNAPPKAVLIEVSNVTRDNALLSEMRLYAEPGSHMAALLERDEPRTRLWLTLSHLYAFDDELMLRAAYNLRRSDQDWVLAEGAGMSPQVIAKLSPGRYPPLVARPANVAALQRLVRDLGERGIAVIPFIAPYHPVYETLVPHLDRFVRQLQAEIGTGTGIVDLSRALTENDDFADVVHVNLRGSLAVTDRLAERLEPTLPRETARECPADPAIATGSSRSPLAAAKD